MTSAKLPRRLVCLFLVLLTSWGALVALLAWRAALGQEQEGLQRLSRGLAAHMALHWPELRGGGPDDPRARQELLRMLMTVNPGIQVYVLDAQGRVQHYIGAPGMVRQFQMDPEPIRQFLDGAALPLWGTDPMGGDALRLISVGAFPAGAEAGSAGYIYIVLDGPARSAVSAGLSLARVWQGAVWAAGVGLLVTLLLGVLAVRWLTRPLNRLSVAMERLDLDALQAGAAPASVRKIGVADDEVGALARAFHAMASRLALQHEQQRQQSAAHREVIANVAHDLRTPLTALHGHLEVLRNHSVDPAQATQHVDTALAQSDKLRRLTQQLFDLATLQSMDHVLHTERFRLDELVADAVQKFDLLAASGRVVLAGAAPGPIELVGDLHLIERALTNLIDNAVRHSPPAQWVRVHLQCSATEVAMRVEDAGPGLPLALQRRLNAGASVRDPALKRGAGGGMGGLGLAIAQRIAVLHGGRLHTSPSALGGSCLCLALPRALTSGAAL
jgi:signal transduction histidine kinase